jgi:hypothetical protein
MTGLASDVRIDPRAFVAGVVAFVVVAALYAQMSFGHPLDEDYAVYLRQAYNMTHHVLNGDMGIVYRFDPSLPLRNQGPLVYPPLLPFLYALPVHFFGYDLELFKALQLVLLLAGLLVFCRAMLNCGYSLLEIVTSLVIFGLSFETRRSVNIICADLPFLLFLFLALALMEKYAAQTSRSGVAWGAAAGAAAFLAIDIRTVGIVLLPALIWTDVARHRRVRKLLLAPLAAFVVLWLGQKLFAGQGEAYEYILHYRFFTPIENARQLYWSLAGPFSWSVIGGAAPAILLALLLLAAVGAGEGVLRGRSVALFMVLYTALLLVLPNFDAGTRYLVPQLLVLGAFACRGASIIAGWLEQRRPLAHFLPEVAAVAGVGLFLLVPRPFPYERLPFGVETPAAQETFAFVRSHVPADALVATSKYRSFSLFTGRRTIREPGNANAVTFETWLKNNKVQYAVVKVSLGLAHYDFSDCPHLPLCGPDASHPYATTIFRNRDFTVFRITPAKIG